MRTLVRLVKVDKREIFRAAADPQKITDMLIGFHPDYAAQMQSEPEPPAPLAPAMQPGPVPG